MDYVFIEDVRNVDDKTCLFSIFQLRFDDGFVVLLKAVNVRNIENNCMDFPRYRFILSAADICQTLRKIANSFYLKQIIIIRTPEPLTLLQGICRFN